jgi:D-alanyl-D-alanine carboxypeptidase
VSKVGYDNKGPILVVVLGSDSHFERFSDLKDVSSWVFNNYVWK